MALSPELVRQIIDKLVKDAPVQIRNRMQKAVPGIVTKMESQGLTPDGAALKVLVRDALFKLWRIVIPSGSITDLIRDSQDDKVLALVEEDLSAEDRQDLTTIVESTMEAALDVTF